MRDETTGKQAPKIITPNYCSVDGVVAHYIFFQIFCLIASFCSGLILREATITLSRVHSFPSLLQLTRSLTYERTESTGI